MCVNTTRNHITFSFYHNNDSSKDHGNVPRDDTSTYEFPGLTCLPGPPICLPQTKERVHCDKIVIIITLTISNVR